MNQDIVTEALFPHTKLNDSGRKIRTHDDDVGDVDVLFTRL